MISVDEALRLTLDLADPARTEGVSLYEAYGRVLAAPAKARLNQPPFTTAMMDGYAVDHRDLPGTFDVSGEVAAGHPTDLDPPRGTALRIFTGAPVPAACDTVIMQEDAHREGNRVTLPQREQHSNIRPEGSDFAEGWQMAPGRRLSAADLALLAAMNHSRLCVAKPPRVAVLAGGDELVAPGNQPEPGQIICSNDVAVATLAKEAGAEVRILPIARDTTESLRHSIESALDCDLIVTIGGASVGDHDLVGKVTESMGMDRAFYRIAMRPGKPLAAGKLGRTAMLGLPGNPVSAIVCAMIFMQPLIYKMQGATIPDRHRNARLATDLPPEGPRRHYLRARLAPGSDLPLLTPFPSQDSGRLRALSEADCLLVREANSDASAAGEVVSFLPLRIF